MFNSASGDQLWTATETAAHWQMSPIEFSPDGRHCAAGMGGNVVVFDERGSPIFRAHSRLESVSAIAWTAEDVFVVAGLDVDSGPPARAFQIN